MPSSAETPSPAASPSHPASPTVCNAVLIASGVALLAWTVVVLNGAHAAGIGALYVVTTSFIFLGLGHLALGLARVPERRLTWAGLRYVVGYALAAFLLTVLAYLRLGEAAVWIAVALAAGGWAWFARDAFRRPETRPRPSLLAAELFVGALLLRAVVQSTGYWQTSGARSTFTQYWDALYHLAMIKDGLYHGMPLPGYPLETGVGRVAYHPAADTMATLFIKTLHLPVDAAYFRIITPVMLLAVFAAIVVFAVAWGRSQRAGLVALGLLGLTFASSWLPRVSGDGGLQIVRYFSLNPPSAVGAVGAMTCLALVALTDEDHLSGPLALAAVIAGATTLMATPIALVLGPAFVAVLVYRLWRARRGKWRPAAVAIAVAIASALVAYPPTIGRSDAPGFRLGGLGRHILDSGEVTRYLLLRHLVAPFQRHGLGGEELFVLAFVGLALLGWRAVVLVAALWRARSRGERPFGRAPLASQMALTLGVLIVLVGLFVAQRGRDSYAPWNVPWHTIQNLWWITLTAAAVAVSAALKTWARPAWLTRSAAWALSCVVVVVALLAALHGITAVRYTDGGRLPTTVLQMMEHWDRQVPRNAVVVQHFELESQNWVSAIGGRQSVLERASWARALYPARTRLLERDIAALYETTSAASARKLALAMGAGYALLHSHDDPSPGLRDIGAPVMRRGGWVLLKLDTSGARS
jgi:hypothetical protein